MAAQSPVKPKTDTLATVPAYSWISSKRLNAVGNIAYGVPLIAGSLVVMPYDKEFNNLRNEYASTYEYHYDDWLQYAPMALTWGLKGAGVESRSSWGRMLTSQAFSALLVTATVNGLKYSLRHLRPDGSQANSYPSGHTATAFMAASFLYKEYGTRYPYLGILGYMSATAVGLSRQLNNRHWMSDVMAGAGLGIISTELGYLLGDAIFKNRCYNKDYDEVIILGGNRHSYVSYNMGIVLASKSYALSKDLTAKFLNGPQASLHGAYFFSNHFGIGGRLAVSYSEVMLRSAGTHALPHEEQYFKMTSAVIGPQYAVMLADKIAIGAHIHGGYEWYDDISHPDGSIDGGSGLILSAGLSQTLISNRHIKVSFTEEYDMGPAVGGLSSDKFHRLVLGVGIGTRF